MSYFVKPSVVRMPVLDGQFVDVKRELCVGDQRRLEAAGMRRVQRRKPNGEYQTELEIDWETYALARAEVWIVDWSLTDDAGQPVPVSYAALKALSPDAFDAIENAISRYIEAVDAEKKMKAQPPPVAAEAT